MSPVRDQKVMFYKNLLKNKNSDKRLNQRSFETSLIFNGMKKFLPYILILVVIMSLFNPVLGLHAQTTTAGGNACAFGSGGTWTDCILDVIGSIAYNTILKLAAFILYLAGTILDFVINFTIVDMASNLSKLTGINMAWKVIRDLMNMAFIFLLVYEAIKLIIGQSDTGKIKNFITFIVLASLLINFSLFFTKVMIDASNIVTIGV